MSQNRCAEEMLTFVAPKCGLPVIRFTNVTQNDHQIPLNAALIIPDASIFSRDRDNLIQFIKTLAPEKSYFLRVGQNSGAGHWSVLHRIPNQGWQLYSSPTSNCMLTTRDNQLIETGAYSILGNPDGTARWGDGFSDYSIAIWEASRERVIDSINFVCGFRSSPSSNPNTCEDVGSKFMQDCGGRLVENHRYLNLVRPVVALSVHTMKKFSDDLDIALMIIGESGGAELALQMIDDSLKRLANREEGEAEIRRRIVPQFSAANGDKEIIKSLESILSLCAPLPETKAAVSDETTLKDLDNLLDMLLGPQNRSHSKVFKDMVIESLFKMHDPTEGAAHILKRIESHIAGATHPQFKASLEEIQDLVQSMVRPRPW